LAQTGQPTHGIGDERCVCNLVGNDSTVRTERSYPVRVAFAAVSSGDDSPCRSGRRSSRRDGMSSTTSDACTRCR
jgi:hypothetical protein